jgi:polo-like kinase 1
VLEKITKKTGETVIKKYSKGKVLGKGGFATCYEFNDLERGKLLAAKIIAKSTLTKKRALEKVIILLKISLSYLLKLKFIDH